MTNEPQERCSRCGRPKAEVDRWASTSSWRPCTAGERHDFSQPTGSWEESLKKEWMGLFFSPDDRIKYPFQFYKIREFIRSEIALASKEAASSKVREIREALKSHMIYPCMKDSPASHINSEIIEILAEPSLTLPDINR